MSTKNISFVFVTLLLTAFAPTITVAQFFPVDLPESPPPVNNQPQQNTQSTQQPQQDTPSTANSFNNPLQANTLQEFITSIINAIVLIAFPFLVLMLVYSGFLFVSAQGNAQKLADARRVFIWTLIGSLLVLGAKALSLAIEATVNDLQGQTNAIELEQSETSSLT